MCWSGLDSCSTLRHSGAFKFRKLKMIHQSQTVQIAVLLNLAAVCERFDACIGQLFICHDLGSNRTCDLATANCFGD